MRQATRGPEVRIVYVERPSQSGAVAPAEAAPAASSAAIAPTASSSPSAVPRGSPSAVVNAGDQLAAERTLLDSARGALEREDGAAALDAIAQHQRRYPNGLLVQEREAMGVRALLLVGRTAEARGRFERFRARFPDSVLLPPLQAAIDATAPQQ
jgi:hypothetical protein